MQVVFVVSRDWTLRTAVRAELREQGVKALGLETADDIGKTLARGVAPAVVVIDAAELQEEPAREAMSTFARQVPVLVIDSHATPGPELPGAERLTRPVSVGQIVARVQEMLAKRTA